MANETGKPLWLVVGVFLCLLGIGMLVGPFWWWALRGMSDAVGLAWFVTDAVLVPIVGILAFGAFQEGLDG